MRAAAKRHEPVDVFMNAASPGVISSFQSNRYYASHEAYVDAIAAAMKDEYEAIAAAGFVLQLDCPDLAMARHTGFQELSEDEFLRRAEYQVEALNHAVAAIPAESDAPAHLLGQLRRPARSRHSAREDPAHRAAREARGHRCSRRPIRGIAMSGRCGATLPTRR